VTGRSSPLLKKSTFLKIGNDFFEITQVTPKTVVVGVESHELDIDEVVRALIFGEIKHYSALPKCAQILQDKPGATA